MAQNAKVMFKKTAMSMLKYYKFQKLRKIFVQDQMQMGRQIRILVFDVMEEYKEEEEEEEEGG